MSTLKSDITNNKDLICMPPKHMRIRKTATAAIKDCVKDLKQKCHFSTAHKEATRLFAQECTKPGGGNVDGAGGRANKNIYSVGPSVETICREVKKGHVGTSPMKMGPVSRIPHHDYRYICNAFASFTAINQLNKCAGLNVCIKMIQNFANALNMSQKVAEKILKRVV
jgi:hypothetical protein